MGMDLKLPMNYIEIYHLREWTSPYLSSYFGEETQGASGFWHPSPSKDQTWLILHKIGEVKFIKAIGELPTFLGPRHWLGCIICCKLCLHQATAHSFWPCRKCNTGFDLLAPWSQGSMSHLNVSNDPDTYVWHPGVWSPTCMSSNTATPPTQCNK